MARRNSGRGGEGEREGFLAKLLPGGEKESFTATELLKRDHDRVRALFREYPENGDGGARRKSEIVGELIRELKVHAKVEEQIFYPTVLDRREKKSSKIVRESFEEHKIVETLLEELSGITPDDDQYDAKVTVLREAVEHHAKEEEDDLFPEAEDLFSTEELEAMGAEIEDRKEEILARLERPRRAARSSRRSRTGSAARRTRARSGSGRARTTSRTRKHR
jgi:hemerythrin superfamily protein